MAKFISFKGYSPKDFEENLIKTVWNFWKSLDIFTKIFIIIFAIFIIVTPYITTNLQTITQLASEPTPPVPFSPTFPIEQSVPDEILVKFKPGLSSAIVQQLEKQYKLTKKETIPGLNVEIFTVDQVVRDQIIIDLRKQPAVEYAEPDYIATQQSLPTDVGYSLQWNLINVKAPSIWNITQGSSAVVVAVIDSGIYANHEDLKGKIASGYNFITNTTDTSDLDGHGTAVAGVIGATTNNAIGIASLGWLTPLMPLKVCEKTSCNYVNIAKAIIYAADHGAKVINISLGGPSESLVLEDAALYAWNRGLVLTASAGNNGVDKILYPAAAKHVLAVGATDTNYKKAYFSNTGKELDLVAPGVDIYSTNLAGNYGSYGGTSLASAHVAALAALLMSAKTSLTNQQIVDYLQNSAARLEDTAWTKQYGWGRIDAEKAILKAINTQ